MLQIVSNISNAIIINPTLYLGRTLLLKPVSSLLRILIWPVTYILSVIYGLCSYVIDIIGGLRTYIIFLAFAILTGAITGLLVHYTSRGLEALLSINPTSHIGSANATSSKNAPQPQRTLQSWRQARQHRKQQAFLEEQRRIAAMQDRIRDALSTKAAGSPTWSQTILEEEDSDF